MKNVRLIHWKESEAAKCVEKLEASGFRCDYNAVTPALLKEIRKNPPAAFVIDLSRLPSQGRDIALNLRHYKATRFVPLIFVGGDPAKVSKIKELLPDAVFSSWNNVAEELHEAMQNAPENPVVPSSVFAAYSKTPLPKKLGIKQNMSIAVINPPDEFISNLGTVPPGTKIVRKITSDHDLIIWFALTKKVLDDRLEAMINGLNHNGSIWIAWPKKTSGVASGLSQAVVRKTGLAVGIVDYKIISIDDVWSALLFTRRKA